MRPSIAAALSTLGPIHSAAAVLLTPEDVDRFADVEGPDEGHRRVIERPDGSLLLVVEFDAPTFDQMSYAFVGAVPKDAWTWADPKKRQPAPLALGVREIKLGVADLDALANGGSATWSLGSPKIVLTADADARAALRPAAPVRVNLDARDIHCLTQGGEIHRGATVGTTTDGRAALQAVTPKPAAPVRSGLTFYSVIGTPITANGAALWCIDDPATTRTPKDGDALESFTSDDLDALPTGARFDDNNGGLSPLVKGPHGWSRAGAAGFCTSADMRFFGRESRTLVLPKPAEAPKPAAPPKVGDRLRDLTSEQRANLPIGTVVTRICLGREASAVLTLDRTSGSSEVTGAVWLVTFNGETREVPAEDLADDNAIVILPAPPPPPPAPKVGDKWGGLTPDQRAALPVGTVLGAIDGLPPVVKVGSGWVCVEDGGKVGGFVPERTIAFLPVSK